MNHMTPAELGKSSTANQPPPSVLSAAFQQTVSPAHVAMQNAFASVCRPILLDTNRQPEHARLIGLLHDSGILVPLIVDNRETEVQQAITIAQVAVAEHPELIDQLAALVENAQTEFAESVNRALQALRVLESVCQREDLVLRLLS